MRRPAILIAIVVANVLLLAWIWLRQEAVDEIPPEVMMTSAQLSQVPDFALLHMTFSGLRVKVEAGAVKAPNWRGLPEAARHALVLTWVEERFSGFHALLVRQQSGPFCFQAGDLTEAYGAIGAAEIADIVSEAGRQAQGSGEDPKAFSDLDMRFRTKRTDGKVPARLREYIRAHGDEITTARLSH